MLPIYQYCTRSKQLTSHPIEQFVRREFSVVESVILNRNDTTHTLTEDLYKVTPLLKNNNNTIVLTEIVYRDRYELDRWLNENTYYSKKLTQLILTPLSIDSEKISAIYNSQKQIWNLNIFKITNLGKFLIGTYSFNPSNKLIETLFHKPSYPASKINKLIEIFDRVNQLFKNSGVVQINALLKDAKIYLTDLSVDSSTLSNQSVKSKNKCKYSKPEDLTVQKNENRNQSIVPSSKIFYEFNSSVWERLSSHPQNISLLDTNSLIDLINNSKIKSLDKALIKILARTDDKHYQSLIYGSAYESLNSYQIKSHLADQGARKIISDDRLFKAELQALKTIRENGSVKITYYVIPFVRDKSHVETVINIARKHGFSRSPRFRFSLKIDTFATLVQLDKILTLPFDAVVFNPTNLARIIFAFNEKQAQELINTNINYFEKVIDHIEKIIKLRSVVPFCIINDLPDLQFFTRHTSRKWIPIIDT